MAVLDKRTRDDPRRRATELAFLRATVALLDEGASFADLNVSRIAERAGRTRTAFYAHFEDRRELLLALVEEAGGEGLIAITPFLAVDGRDEHDELTTSIQGLLATFREHASLVRAVIEAAGYDDAVAAYWDGLVGRFVDAARERLRAAGLDKDEAAATATALVWMTERTCYQQVVRGYRSRRPGGGRRHQRSVVERASSHPCRPGGQEGRSLDAESLAGRTSIVITHRPSHHRRPSPRPWTTAR